MQNQISDIHPLSGLTTLIDLDLSYNKINDATALFDLTELTGLTHIFSLSLSNNNISDIRPLSTMISIKSLRLDNNDINDMSSIWDLPLEYLTMN